MTGCLFVLRRSVMNPNTLFFPPSLLLLVKLRSLPLGLSGKSFSSMIIVSGSSTTLSVSAPAYGFDGAENGWWVSCGGGGCGEVCVGDIPLDPAPPP